MRPAALPIALPREADLAEVWQGQRFPREALAEAEGGPLRVVYRGRRNGGPGPDFLDAYIATPRALRRGDIELHVRSSDFRRHGHHLDPAYDGLALHVVYRDDEPGGVLLSSGVRVLTLELGPWLEGEGGLSAWLRGPPLWQEPCNTAVARMGRPEVEGTLERMGTMRLRQKADACRRALAGANPEQLLYSGLLEVLGYSRNREPFRRLADLLPWTGLRARLLDVPVAQRPLLARVLLTEAAADPSLRWRISGLRPANRPQARLEGAAFLLARWAETGLVASLNSAVAAGPSALLTALSAPPAIGRSRAGELAVNAVLPLLLTLAEASRSRREVRAIEGVFVALPRAARYGETAHLDAALGPHGMRIDARRQQAFLYLQKRYCSQGGCGRCPLS